MKTSIRELLWITLVVGLAVGWYVDRRALVTENAEIRQSRDKLRTMHKLILDQFKRTPFESIDVPGEESLDPE